MRILVVEDEHKIGQAIKQGLEQETYAVDLVFDGEAGYDLAATEDYDVIILDLMLPKMTGLEICQQLRQQDKLQTPILILTAKGQTEDKVNGLNGGADDYLVKPFAFKELLARIKALNRRGQANRNPILNLADLSLNTVSYEVKRGNKTINLSKKEFSLLEYFLSHPGQILTKDQILAHVWDYEADVLPNTVEVYIGYLRKKLGQPNLITTVRGFGYRLENKERQK